MPQVGHRPEVTKLFVCLFYSCYKTPCGGHRSDTNVLMSNYNMGLSIFLKVYLLFCLVSLTYIVII